MVIRLLRIVEKKSVMRQFLALSLVVAFLLSIASSVFSVDTILGIHSPDFSDAGLSNLKNNIFAGKNGWVLDVVYSTDFDWIAGAAANFERVARYGLTPIVRFVHWKCLFSSA